MHVSATGIEVVDGQGRAQSRRRQIGEPVPALKFPVIREFAGNFPSSAGKAAGNVMRFWRSDDQRIQWLAAKFGNYLVDANARFAASSKWRSVMSISTLVNAIDNLAKETKPKHVSAPCPQNYKRRPGNWTPVGRIGEPRKSIRGKEMNITDPIYADEDKAREHLESIQFHQSVAS